MLEYDIPLKYLATRTKLAHRFYDPRFLTKNTKTKTNSESFSLRTNISEFFCAL